MSVDEPVLRVVRGAPTAEELAALVAVVVQLGAPPPAEDGPTAWVRSARPAAGMGTLPGHRGRGAWRASAQRR